MADYFNTNPRDFNYQSLHHKYPLEINGKTKKLNPDNKADGSWKHFIERGPEFKIIKEPEFIQKQQLQKQKEGNQTKRCIEPQYNEQEFKYMQKKRISINNQNNQNQKPGNLLNLLNKEENAPKISKKQFTNIQQQGEAKEIINYQNNDLPELSTNQQNYQYSSNINTLPGSAYYIQPENSQKLPNQASIKKHFYFRSNIQTLPGQENQRSIDKDQVNEKQINQGLYYKKFQHSSVDQDVLAQQRRQKFYPQHHENCYQEYDLHQNQRQIQEPLGNLESIVYQNQDNCISGQRKKQNINLQQTTFQLG